MVNGDERTAAIREYHKEEEQQSLRDDERAEYVKDALTALSSYELVNMLMQLNALSDIEEYLNQS